jgi:hypothetical protein
MESSFASDAQQVLATDGALEYASNELKADKEVVIAAVKQNAYALMYASDELKADPEMLALT